MGEIEFKDKFLKVDYKIGDVIDVTLTFSEKLNTTGTMRVTFDTNDGGTDQHVDITSFGTRVLTKTFNYNWKETL